MKNIFNYYLFLLLSCIFSVSCTDDIYDSDITNKQTNETANINDVIDYAKTQFISAKTKSVSGISSPQNEPQWNNYRIFKQAEDTVSISIPIDSGTNGEQSMLVANQVGSKKQLFYVKLPGNKNDSLPLNIRRRIIIVKDGEKMLYRPVIDKDGRLRIAKLRTTPELKSGTIDGGTLPEVVVYPSSDYDTWWWWWDYIGGIMTLPPPAGTPGYFPDPDPQQPSRPDYFKAENIMKDAGVKLATEQVTKRTLEDLSKEKGRRERGFWVFYHVDTKTYYTGNDIIGPYIKGGAGTQGGEITPGYPPDVQIHGNHIPNTAVPVAFIHVHPPLSYEVNCMRPVGASETDIIIADRINLEFIIIDYVGQEADDGRYYIYGGHEIHDPMTEYYYKPSN